MAQDNEFFVGQKAFIDKNGEVLILNHPKYGLDFPGGKIQIGEEDFDKALHREVKEETGLEIEIGKPFTRWFFKFGENHSKAGKKIFLLGFKCRYIGGSVNLSNEHNGYKWVNKNNYKDHQVNNGYYEALEKYFEGT